MRNISTGIRSSRPTLRVGGGSRVDRLTHVRRHSRDVPDTTRDTTQDLDEKGLGVRAAASIAGAYDLFHWGARNNATVSPSHRKRLRIPEIAYGPSLQQNPRGLRWVRAKFKNYFLLDGVRVRHATTFEDRVRRNRTVFLSLLVFLAVYTIASLI